MPALWPAFGLPGPLSALIVLLVGGSILLLRIPLQSTLGPEAPFLMAWPGILLAAFLGGFWPAVLLTALSVPIGQWALVEGGKAGMGPGAVVIVCLFGLIFAVAGEARLRGLQRARAYAQRLSETQSRLIQVSRLNAAGEMAGSLAHELNQPLTAIGNYLNAAEQLLERQGGDSKVIELVRKAASQSVRAGQIVARVRGAVERGEIEATEEQLSSLVQEAVDVAVAGVAREGVAIRYEFDRTADCVVADRIQVQQVILNLVRNAVEAMESCSRRELRIGSEPADGGFLKVHVADTGPGVTPEVAERLFQPFVSGKAGGMGVGLSISRSIIEAHGGRLWMVPNPDGGATFLFSLPRPAPQAET